MRELTNQEVAEVSGGFVGTPVPFANAFVPGANWPGGAPGVLTGVSMAWAGGVMAGNTINYVNSNVTGMSLGEAIYRTADS